MTKSTNHPDLFGALATVWNNCPESGRASFVVGLYEALRVYCHALPSQWNRYPGVGRPQKYKLDDTGSVTPDWSMPDDLFGVLATVWRQEQHRESFLFWLWTALLVYSHSVPREQFEQHEARSYWHLRRYFPESVEYKLGDGGRIVTTNYTPSEKRRLLAERRRLYPRFCGR